MHYIKVDIKDKLKYKREEAMKIIVSLDLYWLPEQSDRPVIVTICWLLCQWALAQLTPPPLISSRLRVR